MAIILTMGLFLPLRPVLAPFLAPDGKPVLLLLSRDARLVTRVVIAPFYVRFPTDSPTPEGPFPSNYSGFGVYTPRLWRSGVHRAPWSSFIYAGGTVWVAVNERGRWIGECDTPPGHGYIRRARLALAELLTSGDTVRAERIALGAATRQHNESNVAAVVLTVRPDGNIGA
jgi:hypothetical protein